MRKVNKLFFVLFTLCLFLLVAACGDTSEGTTGGDNNSAGNEDIAADIDGETSDPDTLQIGLDDDPPQMDPHRSSAAVDRQTYQSLYNKLIDLDENGEFTPELAKDWTISEDGLTYTFELEEGVVFHDGEPFNAEAVKYNFERMLDPSLASPRASEINVIAEVEAADEYTVVITLDQPFAPFLAALSDRAGMIVSPKAVEEKGEDFANQPVGTGPFAFSERSQQSHIELTRFDDYWRDLPDFEKVLIRPFSDEDVRVTNLVSGDLDIVNKIAYKDLEALQQNSGITVSESDSLGFQGMHFNLDREPFDSKEFRQAFNYAIDRNAIAEVVFRNGVIPAVSGVSPASWAYTGNIEVPEQDMEKARGLIEQSGYQDQPLTLTISPGPEEQLMAEMMQAMLGEVGVTIEIEMVEFGTILEMLDAGDFDMVRLGWSGRVDPDGNLYRFWASDAANNYSNYSSEEVDQLLQEARKSSDDEERKQLYAEVNEILWEDAPYIFIYHEIDYKAMKSSLEGYRHIADTMIRTETLNFK